MLQLPSRSPIPFPDPRSLAEASPRDRLATLKSHLKDLNDALEKLHHEGQGGTENCLARAAGLDDIMRGIFEMAAISNKVPKIAVMATGGYGRGLLNPGSDLDMLFLLSKGTHKLSKAERGFVDAILYPLWDMGFQVGHASRSIAECITLGKEDPHTRTTLFDSRLLIGDEALATKFQEKFRRDVIDRKLEDFLADRQRDVANRYRQYSHTVYLQEPNVKESPGGLRDYHNLLWISDALFQTRDFDELKKSGVLSGKALEELVEAFDFLLRVRNDLHYRDGANADILTLRRQGPVAQAFDYPNRVLLKKIEALMHNYYAHARQVRQHTETIFEIAELDTRIKTSFFTVKKKKASSKVRNFEDFYARDGRLFAENTEVFKEHPAKLLSLFRLCQKHDLSPSPDLRKLIKAHLRLVDRSFRYAKVNRDTFQAILSQKGKVGPILRQMHRVGLLGRYLPEFGKLDCLVQHEFFHRYTADEHTLRCVEQLDALFDSDAPETSRYRELLIKHEDPYALYLALIMHDTGRALDVAEHIDGSAILTDRVCRRLAIKGDRRKLLIFLVDHHLSLYRYATKRDLHDPETITEFAGLMKSKHNLDSLLVFTYADANGTNEEAWSSWKETLMLQLFMATRSFLEKGEKEYDAAFRSELDDLREQVERKLPEAYKHLIDDHFSQMPKRYFRFRNARSIRHHLRAIGQYHDRRRRRTETPFECSMRWLEYPAKGYSELIVAALDQPGLLRRIACALAAHSINILSSAIYTRPDGTVLDLFTVTTSEDEAVVDRMQQLSCVTTLYELSNGESYDPDSYLHRPKNYLTESPITEYTVPVRALVRNDLDPRFTVLEIQAVDRIALLHDILVFLEKHEMTIVHARICTEKGAALDSFYLLKDGEKLSPEVGEKLSTALHPILSQMPGDGE
ncbi:MAG: [protein-PII] uridylyltransferase [Verrucomicrobiota bacterium JB023]|nr:[protein-PII] uridylyltransferase [Verrucomicrobiota bacterium JB023]